MALLWAATKGHLDVVDLLLEKGANIEAADKVIKIDKNSCDIRVNINLNNNSNLFVWCYWLHLKCNKSFRVTQIKTLTVFYLTSIHPAYSIIITLTSSVTVNFLVRFSQDGWTAMIWAAQKGHIGVVALLLDRGANIEAADNVIDFKNCYNFL